MSHGPQPASEPMDRGTALGYVERTKGQLDMFPADDGRWYLFDARGMWGATYPENFAAGQVAETV